MIDYAKDTRPIDMDSLPLARFWSRVAEASSGCLEWQGALDRGGYGKISVGRVSLFAHRVAWAIANGEDPGERLVLHRCDNPRCVRDDHLYAGTYSNNSRDAVVRGRTRPRGPSVRPRTAAKPILAPGGRWGGKRGS